VVVCIPRWTSSGHGHCRARGPADDARRPWHGPWTAAVSAPGPVACGSCQLDCRSHGVCRSGHG
jgi:hypothetical protein